MTRLPDARPSTDASVDTPATPTDAGRRTFLARAGTGAGALAAGALLAGNAAAQPRQGGAPAATTASASGQFWPNGIRLVISISMQFEAGGQPPKGT